MQKQADRQKGHQNLTKEPSFVLGCLGVLPSQLGGPAGLQVSRGEPGPGWRFIRVIQIQLVGVVQAGSTRYSRGRDGRVSRLTSGVWGQPAPNRSHLKAN